MHKYVGEQFVVNEFKDLEFECEANSTYISLLLTADNIRHDHVISTLTNTI